MPDLHCIVVTPETTVVDQTAEFVVLTLYDGEIGIAPGHSPMIGRLGFGEMRVTDDARTRRYYVEGGFVQVIRNTVTVLTGRAIPAEAVDAQVAEQHLAAAQGRRVRTPEEMALRDRAVAQARAQLRVASKV